MCGRVGGGGGVMVDVNEELKFLGKFKKKLCGGRVVGRGGGGGREGCGVRVDVNEELKFLEKFKKKKIGEGVRVAFFFFWGGGSGWGVRLDVNEELKFL